MRGSIWAFGLKGREAYSRLSGVRPMKKNKWINLSEQAPPVNSFILFRMADLWIKMFHVKHSFSCRWIKFYAIISRQRVIFSQYIFKNENRLQWQDNGRTLTVYNIYAYGCFYQLAAWEYTTESQLCGQIMKSVSNPIAENLLCYVLELEAARINSLYL